MRATRTILAVAAILSPVDADPHGPPGGMVPFAGEGPVAMSRLSGHNGPGSFKTFGVRTAAAIFRRPCVAARKTIISGNQSLSRGIFRPNPAAAGGCGAPGADIGMFVSDRKMLL